MDLRDRFRTKSRNAPSALDGGTARVKRGIQARGEGTVYLTSCIGAPGALLEKTQLSSLPHKFWKPHSK